MTDYASVFAPPRIAPTPTTKFEDWVRTASGGDIYVYATRHVLDCKTPQETQDVALAAKRAYARGEVELVQRRTNGRNSPFDYVAIKRHQRIQPKVFGEPWQVKIIGTHGRGR